MGDAGKEIERFSEEIQGFLGKAEKQVITELEGLEKRCLESSMEDIDRYADCMSKTIKRVEKEEARFQYRIAFLQHRLHGCFTKQEATRNFEVCKTETRQNFQKYIDDFIKTIKH